MKTYQLTLKYKKRKPITMVLDEGQTMTMLDMVTQLDVDPVEQRVFLESYKHTQMKKDDLTIDIKKL